MAEDIDDEPLDASNRTKYLRVLQTRVFNQCEALGLNPRQISFVLAQDGVAGDGHDRVVIFCDPDYDAFLSPDERAQKDSVDAALAAMLEGEKNLGLMASPPPESGPEWTDES